MSRPGANSKRLSMGGVKSTPAVARVASEAMTVCVRAGRFLDSSQTSGVHCRAAAWVSERTCEEELSSGRG